MGLTFFRQIKITFLSPFYFSSFTSSRGKNFVKQFFSNKSKELKSLEDCPCFFFLFILSSSDVVQSRILFPASFQPLRPHFFSIQQNHPRYCPQWSFRRLFRLRGSQCRHWGRWPPRPRSLSILQ